MKGKLIKTLYKAKFAAKKYSPEILLAVGVVAGVGCLVEACKGSLKVEQILDEHSEKIDKIETAVGMECEDGTVYSEEDQKKDTLILYRNTAVKFIKTYWKAAVLGLVSVTCVLAGFGIMKKRYLTTTATLAAVESAFGKYRDRVVEDLGKAKDLEYRYGMKVEEVDVVDADGKPTGEKNYELLTSDDETDTKLKMDRDCSVYSKFFDSISAYYSKNPEDNRFFLTNTMKDLNRQLQKQGYLWLNDAYRALGLPETMAGQQAGWIANGTYGDPFVDFDMFNIRPKNRDFINGIEPVILVDFNCMGDIREQVSRILYTV